MLGGTVTHACKPTVQEAKEERLQVQGQSELPSMTLKKTQIRKLVHT